MNSKDKVLMGRKSRNLLFLMDVLRKTYGYDDKVLYQSIKKAYLFGDNGLEKQREYPEKVVEIILPLLLSYREVDDKFRKAVDILVKEGIDMFDLELSMISITI